MPHVFATQKLLLQPGDLMRGYFFHLCPTLEQATMLAQALTYYLNTFRHRPMINIVVVPVEAIVVARGTHAIMGSAVQALEGLPSLLAIALKDLRSDEELSD